MFEEITSLRLNKTEINLFLTNIHSLKLFQRIVIMEVYALEYEKGAMQHQFFHPLKSVLIRPSSNGQTIHIIL